MSIPEAADFGAHLPRHRLRVRRWLMASTFYVVGVPFVLYGYQQGQMLAEASWAFIAMALLGNALLGIYFYSRRNEHYEDPSLTIPQMLLAITATLVFAGGATPSLRPTISLGLLAPLIFGCFQLRPPQLLRMAGFAMAGYGFMLLVVWLQGRLERTVVEITHWMGLNLMLAASVAICSEIARMRDRQRQLSARLQESADRDMLTGLFNRRWLGRQVPPLIELAHRHQRPLSACMIDIDHFKAINDHHGHLVGDSALQWLTVRIRLLLRQSDAFVRVGGEEFLLILPETDLDGATEMMERVRHHLAQSPFNKQTPEPIPITISAGVAQLRDGEVLEHLMSRADAALYEAKQAGRNRVVSR